MAYKFNPFTGTLDYYVTAAGTPYILTEEVATASYSVLVGDFNKIIYMSFNGDRTVTLPAAPADGSWVIIADADRSGYGTNYVINVVASGGDSVQANATPMLGTNQSTQFVYVASITTWIAV